MSGDQHDHGQVSSGAHPALAMCFPLCLRNSFSDERLRELIWPKTNHFFWQGGIYTASAPLAEFGLSAKISVPVWGEVREGAAGSTEDGRTPALCLCLQARPMRCTRKLQPIEIFSWPIKNISHFSWGRSK